jgi:mRNA interferase MazF
MKRYEVRWARLDPVQGSELGKTRPVVIVSLDALNRSLGTITVCPITSQLHPRWRSRLAIRCAGQPAEIAVDQIRTLSKRRLGPLLDSISSASAAALRSLIKEMYAEE